MEQQLDRIATAFERIAAALELIGKDGLPLEQKNSLFCLLAPHERAFKVELSNCTDTETPFDIQIHD